MTSFRLISDSHLEFMADKGQSFIDSLNPIQNETLIIAGDFAPLDKHTAVFRHQLERLIEKFPRILYVAGNHDYYGAKTTQRVLDYLAALEIKYPDKFYFLNRKVIELDGVVIAGTTLWYPILSDNSRFSHLSNDFNYIPELNIFAANNYELDKQFLSTLKKADILITHMEPSPKSTPKGYIGSALNRYFVTDIEKWIKEVQPMYVLSGHTHTNCDYFIEKTHMICNPLGYPFEYNTKFQDNLIIEI
jgi:Icc-related predicted phosphoesterase